MDPAKRIARYDDLYDLYAPLQKIRSKIRLDPKTGCYIWTGNLHRQGYGMIGCVRKSDMLRVMTVVHRVIMRQIMKRALDKDEDVIHTCKNNACLNPNHLRLRSIHPWTANAHRKVSANGE